MTILCTSNPGVKTEAGGRIVIDIASGRDTVEIALSLHQALALVHALRMETVTAMTEGFASTRPGDLVQFNRKAGRR